MIDRDAPGFASNLDALLGDPADASHPCGWAQVLGRDERDEYPAAALALLHDHALHEQGIPSGEGGAMRDLAGPMALLRRLSRRDMTLALSFAAPLFTALPVWIAGSAEQRTWMLRALRDGQRAAFCISERDHGSDLLANETVLRTQPGGYALSGEKWPINGVDSARLLVVLTGVDGIGHPGRSALILLDKQALPARTWHTLPAERTVGVRGLDLAGIVFDGCRVPPDCVIGGVGDGLSVALSALHVSRTLCAGLSLGAVDTALRTTFAFVSERALYGHPMLQMPHVRQRLVEAVLDIQACECLSLVAARVLQADPSQAALWSATLKVVVPTTVDAVIRSLAELYGARHYLRGPGDGNGVFQKAMRDAALVPFFDGNVATNLGTVAQCLGATRGAGDAVPASWFDLDRPLPPLDLRRMRGGGIAGNRLAAALAEPLPPAHARGSEIVDRHWQRLHGRWRELTAGLARRRRALGPRWARSQSQLDGARHYCRLHTEAACLLSWHAGAARLVPPARDPRWLERLLARCGDAAGDAADTADEVLADDCLALLRARAAGTSASLWLEHG